jgi:hypothetical protein
MGANPKAKRNGGELVKDDHSTARVQAWRKANPERNAELNRIGKRRRRKTAPEAFLRGIEISEGDLDGERRRQALTSADAYLHGVEVGEGEALEISDDTEAGDHGEA